MLDYWGLAFKQAAQELRAKLSRRQRDAGRRPALEDRGMRPASAGRRSSSDPTS